MSVFKELNPIQEHRTQFAFSKREHRARVNIPNMAYWNQHIDIKIPHGSRNHVNVPDTVKITFNLDIESKDKTHSIVNNVGAEYRRFRSLEALVKFSFWFFAIEKVGLWPSAFTVRKRILLQTFSLQYLGVLNKTIISNLPYLDLIWKQTWPTFWIQIWMIFDNLDFVLECFKESHEEAILICYWTVLHCIWNLKRESLDHGLTIFGTIYINNRNTRF